MVPATLNIGGVAYAALGPAAPPPKAELELLAPLPPPPARHRVDLDKVETLTTWSVLSQVKP
jgi:hypothetical protein